MVENEVIFRKVNESVKDFVNSAAPGKQSKKQTFYCECARPDCIEKIKLTIGTYEDLHKSKKLFVTIPGHEFPIVEDVILKSDEYQIVEKHNDPPSLDEIKFALKSIKV